MVGHVTTPVCLDQLSAERLDIGKQMLGRGAPARRHNMGMLQQQEILVLTIDEQRSLQPECITIGDPSQPADPQGPLGQNRTVVHGPAQRTSASQSRVSMISLTRCRNAAA